MNKKNIPQNNASLPLFPSQFSPLYTKNFGFGEKIQFMKRLPADESPPPSKYKIGSQFLKNLEDKKGNTFGIARKYYDSVFIPNTYLVSLKCSTDIPGSGKYPVQNLNTFGSIGTKCLIREKISIIDKSARDFPAPNSYHA